MFLCYVIFDIYVLYNKEFKYINNILPLLYHVEWLNIVMSIHIYAKTIVYTNKML